MKNCVVCERKSNEIPFGEGAKGDRRKLIIYGTEKIIHICQPCRLFMGQRWCIHPKVKGKYE